MFDKTTDFDAADAFEVDQKTENKKRIFVTFSFDCIYLERIYSHR